MRKSLLFGLCGFVLSGSWVLTSHAAGLTSLNEGFENDVPAGLIANGWLLQNNSTNVAGASTPNWIQGNSTFGTAQGGSPNSFIVAGIQNTGTISLSSTISNWLVTPQLTLANGDTFSFYTMTSNGNFANELQVRLDTTGSSPDVGTLPTDVGNFTTTLLEIGSSSSTGPATPSYPTAWTPKTITISGLSGPTQGWIAFRYFVPDTLDNGSDVKLDTVSFIAPPPTLFTRTVTGNWTDTTGWTPSGVPNGNTVTAQLVTPGMGTNSVDLGGGTFTLNQLQFFGAGAGSWSVTNGTIIFDGTNPLFLNLGGTGAGVIGTLTNLQLNADTTFEIDNASATTEVTGTISGTGGLTKTGSGALVLIGINTYTGGTNLNGGVLAVDNDGNLGSGALSFNGGTLEALAAGGGITSSKAVSLNAGGGTFSADAGTNSTLSGAVGGAGSFTKNGSGTLSLTGTNTYSGGTNLNGGILAVDSDGNLGTGALSFNGGTLEALAAGGGITSSKAVTLNTGGGTFLADAGTSSTLSGVIGGAGSFTKNGSGTLSLTGANTYSGGTSLNGGILAVDSDSNLGTGALRFNEGTLEGLAAGGGITSSKAVTLNAGGGTFSADAGTNSTLSGAIGGAGSFTKNGSGTLTLTGANTYSGGTSLNGGILAVDSDSNLGTGTLSFNGGTLEALAAGGGITSSKAVTLNAGGGTFSADAGTNSTLSGAIGGAGSFTKNGSGTLTLTGANTYSGGTSLNGGVLAVNSDGNLGSGALSFNGGTLEALAAGGGITSSKAVTLNAGGGTFLADAGTSSILSGAISGAGSFTKDGPGTLTLSGNNTYSGATTVASGILQAGSSTALSTSSAFTVNSVLDLNGFSDTIGSLAGTGTVRNNGAASAALTVDADNTTTTFSGVVQNGIGVLQLTKTGTGTLILTGTNTYTGGTTISAGTLQIGNGSTGSITGNIIDNAALSFDRSNAFVINSSISGTGSVAQNGSSTLTLSGNNTYGGATTVALGTLQAGSSTAFSANSAYTVTSNLDLNGFSNTIGSLTGTGTVLNNGAATVTLTVGAENTTTAFSGVIQNGLGVLQLTKTGTGTLILAGNNTYTGGTTISAGTLQIDGTSGSITGNIIDNAALAFDRSNAFVFSGSISGTGSVAQNGSSTLTLSGNNTYSGATTVALGTLQAGSSTAFSANSAYTVTSNLDLNGFSSTIGSLAGAGTIKNNGGNLAILSVGNANSTTTFNGTLADGASRLGLNKVGVGRLVLTAASTYTGGTTITAGILQIGNGTASGSITGNITDNGVLEFNRPDTVTFPGTISGAGSLTQSGTGVLILTGTNTYTGGTTISSGTLQIGAGGSITGNVVDNGLLLFDQPGNVTFAGTISGSGNLTQTGTGILTLTADNTFTGTTTIVPGSTVQLGNGGTTGSVSGNVVDNGTLSFNRSNTLNYSGVISGTGSVLQDGTGTTILSGANTYAGGTVVNAGTLTVNNGQALGVGNVEVNGGILRADPQPINVKGNYTQNAGGTLQLQLAGASSGQYDYLNVGGNASLGGTLQLLSLGFQPKAGDQLTLVLAGGMISGRFATFLDPFAKGPGFNTVDLIYGKISVQLEFLNMSLPVPPPIQPPSAPPVIVTINFESFGLTPNQRAAGNLVDKIELDPGAHDLVAFLAKESAFNLAGDLEQISPDVLTAFYEITFSNANIQRLNLEVRLDDLRSGSNGFSSNMKVNGATVNLEDKATEDGKGSKNPVEQALQPGPENRWGVWVTGFGDFVNVDGDANANGYDFTTGGFSLA